MTSWKSQSVVIKTKTEKKKKEEKDPTLKEKRKTVKRDDIDCWKVWNNSHCGYLHLILIDNYTEKLLTHTHTQKLEIFSNFAVLSLSFFTHELEICIKTSGLWLQ